MKKIYLFLIAFCLFAGNVWAKTFTYNFDWRTDKAVCTVNQMSGSSLGNSYYATWLYQLIPNYVNTSSSAARPALSLELGFDNYYDGYYTLSYMETAPWDTYTCSTTTSFGSCPSHILCALGNCFYLDESGNKYTFKSGSIVVENGRHGYAYMYSKNLKDNSNNTFNVTVGQSLNLTTNYTELEIATDAKNKKAALFAFDGENRLNLIFDVATLNETIGIPAGTYTIGTNVFGEAYDIDGQTKWELKSGTIKISQSGSNLVLSTTSLKGLEPDDTGTYNLSLSCNLTPSISAASSVTDVNAVMNVDEYNEWFQVWGFDGDAKDLGMRISVYKGIVPGGNVSAASPTNYLLDIDNGGTMIATKNGKIAANENYIVSNLYYDKFYKTGTADIAMKGIDGNFYMGRIYTTFFMCDGAMYLEYDATQSFGSLETNYPWDEIEFGEADEEEGTYSIVGKGGEYQLSLSCIHPLDGIGYLPTGNYSINPSHTAGSLQVGGYDMNEGDVNGSLVFASNLLEGGDGTLSNDNFWTLRGGKVSITNVNEQYYVIVDALNDRCEDTETKYTIQYTIGEAPKTLVINVRGDGSAAGSFTWTAEGWEGHISNFPQDVPFQLFEGQQIDIHATPNAGSKFVRWEIDGVTVSEDEDFSYIVAATTSTIVAVFEEVNETYTLTWDFNGGETTSADGDYTNGANITEGEFIVAPADPTLEGYTFAGWLNSITGEKEMAEDGYMPTPMPAEDLTYTAQWTANTYTVHFDKNNDFYQAAGAITGEMEDQLFTYDAEDVALTANAYEWAGHTFQGWATAADGEKVYEDGEAVSNLTAEQNGEVVLYAVWDINEYTITFQDAETDGGYVWGSDDFAYGTVPAYNGEPMPSKEADEQYTYQFAGWKDAAGIEYPIGTDLLSVEGEATYYAVYTATKVPYELVWEVNGGDELTGDYTQGTVEWGTEIVAPATPTREGYTFTGWMNGNTNEIETPAEEINVMPTAMPAEGLTYTAQWTANTYTVRFDYSGDYYQVAGAITGEMEDQLFTYDAEDVALTVNAYEWAGHTFQGWATAADGEKVYEDGEAVSNLTSQQNGVVTLYAVWKTNNYTITFQDAEADGGHVWGSDDFAYGTVPAYNGEPMPSKEADEQYTYQFAGWKDAAGIKYPIGTDLPAVEGETTYYAVYIPTKVSYELVWDVNGGDELTGDYTQGTVEWGTEIVAPAAPTREGYTFTGWMNGNTNEIELPAEETNIMPFAMPVDGLTYAAQWEANVYYVRFFDNGEYYNAAGTIEGTMPDQTFYYDEGQYLQANAFTWEGHTFQGWATTADGEVVYGDVEDITDNLTSVKDAVIELYAVWTTDTYTITFKNSMGDDDYVWWSGELAYGTIPVYEGETPVKAADADYTYTFAGWMVNLEEQYPIGTDLPKVTEDATYLAMYTQEKTQFAVRFVNPDGSELQRYELPIGAVPAYDGVPTQANEGDEYNYYVFTFTGWIDDANNSYGASATLPAVTGEITYMAQYSKQLFINLQEQMDDDYYTDFSDKYNGERATTATLVRKFDQGKWATLCLPFNVNAAVLTSSGLKSRIYEFKYTKGDAENGFTLYFAQANKLDAGKGYIVNANAVLAQKTQFVFPNVVVNTNADIQSGFDITTLEGYNSQGNIYLVGTLRQGKVLGDDGSGIYYMGLSSNKIKLANSTTGTVVRAYRGIFRSTERIQVSRVRIVAESEDGEIVDELEVVDGEMKEASAPYKYVQDGILYIVRDGVRYTAEGQRID